MSEIPSTDTQAKAKTFVLPQNKSTVDTMNGIPVQDKNDETSRMEEMMKSYAMHVGEVCERMGQKHTDDLEKMDQRRVEDLKMMEEKRAEDLKEMDQRRADELKQMEERHKEMDDERSREAANYGMELHKLNGILSGMKHNETEILVLQKQYATVTKQLEDKQKELTRKSTATDQLKEENKQLKTENKQLKTENKQLKTDQINMEKRKHLEREIYNLKEQRNGLKDQIEKLRPEKKNSDDPRRREANVEAMTQQQRGISKVEPYIYMQYSSKAGETRFSSYPAMMYSRNKASKK